jgi:hypothetical protein
MGGPEAPASGPSVRSDLGRIAAYGPVIVRYGPLKPTNDTVYVKLESVMPPGIVGVQFGLGHDCCARKSASDGPVTDSEGTVSLPFFGESWPVLDEAVKVPWCCESDGFPPPLMHTTVAAYEAPISAWALVLPTPASSNELHETLRPLTAQPGEPLWTCVPLGAFAGLNVVVVAADAAEGSANASIIGMASSHRSFFMVILLSVVNR